jgi:preprotein translocase subunit SecY
MSKSDEKMSPKELRKFGLVTGGMLILFFDLLIPWIWGFSMPLWPLIVAGVLASMALAFPASLGPVYKVWMRFAEALGWVNTRIILSVIFFVIFFPFGLIMRMFNDPMRRKLDASADSYRLPSNPTKPDNMERPF